MKIYVATLPFILFSNLAAAETIQVIRETPAVERRSQADFMRGPFVNEFYKRYKMPWKHQAAIHVAHGKAHDVFHLAKLENTAEVDKKFVTEMRKLTLENPPKTEPEMQTYGPFIGQSCWQLYRTIDWTHIHHGATYDVLSDISLSRAEQKKWTDKTVEYYLKEIDIPRSPAPLDVTMRRAGVMMKPYFTYFRNFYPESARYFFAAHWWHPAIYEAMMRGSSAVDQKQWVEQTDSLTATAFSEPPLRMLLSRELMPTYSRFSPESANIFDNLHMLHGIAYDIMSYPKWTLEQKRAELNRVIKAMSYQPGDEKLARKFPIPHPDMDPRRYEDWMKSPEGEMSRIMTEMMDEMMPTMMPTLGSETRSKVMAQFKMKMQPGQQPGEISGSLHDALMALAPDMKMVPGEIEPGESSPIMMQTMMAGWTKKYGMISDVPALEVAK